MDSSMRWSTHSRPGSTGHKCSLYKSYQVNELETLILNSGNIVSEFKMA